VSSYLTPEGLTAIGTLTAVVVALVVAFLPRIFDYYNRPVLKIEFENGAPFCQHRPTNTPVFMVRDVEESKKMRINSYFVRLRVRNSGKSSAKEILGKLVRIRNAKTGIDYQIDPVPLHWASIPEVLSDDKLTLNLNQDEPDFIEVLFVCDEPKGRILIYSSELVRRDAEKILSRDNYLLDISFYGENFSSVQRTFLLECGKNWDEVTLEVHGKRSSVGRVSKL
jgi:hypothetical protein